MKYRILIQWSDEDQTYAVLLPEWEDRYLMPVASGKTCEEAMVRGVNSLENIIAETREADLSEIERSAREHDVPFAILGRVSNEKTLAIRLDGRSETSELRESLAVLRQRWEGAIPWAMR